MKGTAMTEAEQLKIATRALAQIASMVDPADMEEDGDGFTEWGCDVNDAVFMAYENCITLAQMALGQINAK